MPLPIGQFMVDMNILTPAQRDAVLERQRESGRPFGELAERLFGIDAAEVERAWAHQYAETAETVDPTVARVDPLALGLVNRRQAWQFKVLPMRYDGGQVVMATTRDHLVRALNFTTRHLRESCYFVVADAERLGEALMRHYPMDGMTSDVVTEEGEGKKFRRGKRSAA